MSKHVIVLDREQVRRIKVYKGIREYYKIELNAPYNTRDKGQKNMHTAKKLLMHPEQVIAEIHNVEILYELRDIIDERLRVLLCEQQLKKSE